MTVVYFNMREAERGLESHPGRSALVFAKLLDECSRLIRIPGGQRASRLFLRGGHEVKAVSDLKRDDALFMS